MKEGRKESYITASQFGKGKIWGKLRLSSIYHNRDLSELHEDENAISTKVCDIKSWSKLCCVYTSDLNYKYLKTPPVKRRLRNTEDL